MIYLLRHGEITNHEEKSFIGQSDVALSERGVCQAYWWRQALHSVSFEQIYSSDLTRSHQTARIITDSQEGRIQVMPQFREIHLGEWEGLSMAEVRGRFPEKWEKRGENLISYRPAGGENFADLYARVVPAYEDIAKYPGTDTLIVAHAGVNRVILCSILGMPLLNIFCLGQDYGAMNMISYRKDLPRVVAMNKLPPI